MQRLTLREAAERTSRSITTLRRYIRSGRLHAEKRYGRFGPEYYVAADDLAEAGLDLETAPEPASSLPEVRYASTNLSSAAQGGGVPITLYQELQMKHEQLLVQYGMIRAGGLRAMDLQEQAEVRQRELDSAEREIRELRQQLESRHGELRAKLADAELEIEGKSLEIAALRSKVRALEMLTRNAVTNETIENQFLQIRNQERRVEDLGREASADKPEPESAGMRPGVHSIGEMIEPDH